MDSLYLDTPRPFSKFPVGYRPVSRGGGVIRTMSSLSLDHSRINAANAFYDQGMPPQQLALTDFAQGYSVSPESNMYRTTNPPTRNVQQSSLPASVEHIADVEESFPEIDAKRSGHTPWDGRSNAPVRNSYGGAALLAELGNSDEFRWKLRRQREKIKDYRRQIDSENNTLNVEVPYEKFGDSKVAWRNGNANRRGSFTQSNTYPKSVLYKTHSDSSLFQDLDYAPYPSLNPESTQIPPRTADSIRPPEGFGRMPSPAERRAPMEGFFAPKPRQDPVWVTSPPPPFQIQEDIRMPKSFYYSSKQQIHLPYSRELSAPAPDLDQGNMMNFGVNQWTEEPPPSTYNLAPTNLSFAVEPNQVPMEQHNPEIGASNTAGRLQFATIETEPSRVLPRGSLEMPSLCKTSLHEYIAKRRGHSGHHSTHGPGRSSSHNVPEVPVGISHAPPTNLQSSSERNSPTRDFNEQGSTYPVGTNFMRGLFGNSLGNGGVVRSIPRTSRKAQILQKERSFAIISRPLTPPAILQNVSDVVDLGSQYRPSAASESLDKMRRGSDPVSPPVCAVSRPESDSFNRNLGSPLSPYDSESEERFRSNQTVLNIPSNQAQLIGTPPAHGILLKNHEGVTRPSKKVVFQCDSLEADRCLQTNVNSTEAPPHVRAYDAALADVIENWSTLSDQIGGDVKLMREKVTAVFSSLRIFLWTAACQAEPSADEVQRLVSPIVNLLSDINRFKDSKRKAPQFNHLCAVAEGIPAVGWVLVKKTPAAHVKEMLEASMFYVNRVLKEFKDGDQKNIEWARSWKNLLETMHTFVRQTHTTGLEWNSAPGCSPPPSDARLTGSQSAAQGPPPPPPPPPPGLFAAEHAASAADAGKAGRDALFAEINKGEAVTAGLRKVTADMQTHKNPALREHPSNVPPSRDAKPNPPVPAATVAKPPNRNPPRIELKDGKQWNVEFIVGNPNVVVNVTDKKQTVYIYKCEDSVIAVKGKLNSITLDSCRKTSVVFDAVVAQCETINCQRIEIQTLGEMPTISIQKTDGCQVYLSPTSKNAEIVTSKSSEMNVLIPKNDGDYMEFPIPEQFKTTFDGGKLVTCVSDIS